MQKLPEFALKLAEIFSKNHKQLYLVGGCVRDLLMDKEPKDWDFTTDARPEEMLGFLPDCKYTNDFGTVLCKINSELTVEITTYRSEGRYSDRRHPDEIKFETDIEKDLERRDFTVNALAIQVAPENSSNGQEQSDGLNVVDLFGGRKDIGKKVVRAVGEPSERFKEDALRMLRAIRFSCQLGFAIEPKTERAIVKLAGSLKFIAKERIRDELIKILETPKAYEGFMLLHQTKLLNYIFPELYQGIDMPQNHHHIYTVFKHLLESLHYCPSSDWRVKLAALFHDIGKPKARKIVDGQATFYNHEYLSERMARKILSRLKFSSEDTQKISSLVRNHMFYYNVGEVTEASVRRLIRKVGQENLRDLIDLRIADRLGSGTPKAKPYKLRHLEYMMEKVQNDPVSVKMLAINGDQMISELKFSPGPKMGAILDILLSEVIEDPALNSFKYLSKRAQELEKEDIMDLRQKAKDVIEDKRGEDDQKIKRSYRVK